MNDETTRTDGWATPDASGTAPEGAATAAQTTAATGGSAPGYVTGQETWVSQETVGQETSARPVGFCQDCGRGLTPETLRTVGTGVFCEPCLETRLRQGPVGAAPGASGTPGYNAAQPGAYAAVPVAMPAEPNPILAGLLGLIPGVGAMYNGQFAKGVIHLIIFVILVSLSDDVNGIFGLFVAGWVFYQAFEAYHTAKARLEGLPLPNAFGFNDIGERMGFGRSGPGTGAGWTSAQRPPYAPPTPYTPPSPPPYTAPNPYTAPPVSAVPPAAGRDWVGYVPPTTFASAPQAPPAPFVAPAGQTDQQASAPWGQGHAPYVETYTGAPPAPGPQSPIYAAPPVVAARRFPVGALWLIGLGMLILLANLVPDWRIGGRWWPPLLFAGLAVWLFARRLHSGARLACIVRWPVILMVLAVLFALHAAYFVVTFGMTCAVLLIVFGALLLVERTLGAGPGYAAAEPVYGTPAPSAYSAAPDPARASFTTAGPAVNPPVSPDDPAKGGQ